jgi:hypothetical protein
MVKKSADVLRTDAILRALNQELREARRNQWRLCGADYVRGLERAIAIVRELSTIKPRTKKP